MAIILISPSGQRVQALTKDIASDFMRQGYRLPPPDPGPGKVPTNLTSAPKPEPISNPSGTIGSEPVLTLNLMEATLAQLVDLPDVGTARAKKIRTLAESQTLSLDTLQAEVPEVDWVGLYQSGQVVWPGGLSVVEQPESTGE